METITQNPKEYFRTLSIMHLALVLGQVLFALVIVFMFGNGSMSSGMAGFSEICFYIVSVISVCGLLGAVFVYKSKLERLKSSTDLKTMMTGYRSVLLVRYAFLEVPSMISIVAAWLTGNYLFLLFAGALIAIMIYWRPAKNMIVADLQLGYQDLATLEDPNAIIAEFKKAVD